jgi:ribosome biogenesis GTPase A
MAQLVLSPKLSKQHDAIRDLLQKSISLTERCSDSTASKVLWERLSQLQSAALFVIVGEVKAGKSSFVNALLREDICEVAPDPCTAGIQELVYGKERATMTLGDSWERVSLPLDVLQEISIVDTPGTNSIITNHQTITENYIPQSDLVVFVFPAKNPHTASAWDLLGLIRKDWHRKMVFVLQQADLATQRELATNIERMQQYARERNVQNPKVFTVSAKRESEGASDSGFTEFRQFLNNAVETGEVWKMKVEGAREMVRKIVGKLHADLQSQQAGIAEDKAFYEKLLSRVQARREKADALRRLAVDSICVSYNRLADKLEKDFNQGLEISNVLRRSIPFIRDKNFKAWAEELESNFKISSEQEIKAEAERVSKDITCEMVSMFSELTEAIAHRKNNANQIFSNCGSDRAEILSRLQTQLQHLRIENIVKQEVINGDALGTLTLAGGGLAALGGVIAFVTQITVLDVTGGALAAIGAALVTFTLVWSRSSITNDITQKIGKSREEFRGRLDEEISNMFDNIFLEIEHLLNEPVSDLANKACQLVPLAEEAKHVEDLAETMFQ